MNSIASPSPRKGFRADDSAGQDRRRKSLRPLSLGTILRTAARLVAHRELRLFRQLVSHRKRAAAQGVGMWYQFWRFIDNATYAAGRLDRQQWVVLSFLVLGLGFVCMRGFGSRTNY